MVKLKGPSLSLEASGKLADAIVFSKQKGGHYIKRHAKPANPKTIQQVSARAIIPFLGRAWKQLSTAQQDTWYDLAKQLQLSAYHAYIKYNASDWAHWLQPGKTYPVPHTGPWHNGWAWYAYDGIGCIKIDCEGRATDYPWGMILHMQTFLPIIWEHDNVVKVYHVPINATETHYITPLDPGIYYLTCSVFGADGNWSYWSKVETRTVT